MAEDTILVSACGFPDGTVGILISQGGNVIQVTCPSLRIAISAATALAKIFEATGAWEHASTDFPTEGGEQ